MIAVLLAVQAAAPVPAAESDVVVIGRRLQDWRAVVRGGDGEPECVIKRSTGEPEIDAIGCSAMVECWPDANSRYQAALAKGMKRADRRRMLVEADAAFGACVFPKREALIQLLADRRVAARGKTR